MLPHPPYLDRHRILQELQTFPHCHLEQLHNAGECDPRYPGSLTSRGSVHI